MENQEKEKIKEWERTTRKKKWFLKEFNESLGIITIACARSGVGRRTYYNWIGKDSVFRSQCEYIERYQMDYVEDKLMMLILKGHPSSIMFYLSRRSDKFRDKVEVSNEDTPRVYANKDWYKRTDFEKKLNKGVAESSNIL